MKYYLEWLGSVFIFFLIVGLLHSVINLTIKSEDVPKFRRKKNHKNMEKGHEEENVYVSETNPDTPHDKELLQPYDANFADFESSEDDLMDWFKNEVGKVSENPDPKVPQDQNNEFSISASNDNDSVKNHIDEKKNGDSSTVGLHNWSNYANFAPF